ncbi:MAG: PhnD/SsuA/transferrin family substrate-binding protein, partial [Coprobacillus sp.]
MKKLKKLVMLSLAMICILGATGCSSNSDDTATKWPDKIVLAQMPNENNPDADSQHKKFGEALAKYLGIEVEAVEGTEYTAGIEGMANKKVDV